MTAIVLLPGMDGTGKMFAAFLSCLTEKLRPVVISYPPNQAFGYTELEAYVQDHLPKNESFILLAESFSGPVAISLASSKPAGLIGVILCCTFARNPVPIFRFLINLMPKMVMNAKLATMGAPLLFGRYSTKELRVQLEMALHSIPGSTLMARMKAVIGVDVSKKAQEINVPTLYVQASEDRIVPKSAGHLLQSLTKGMHVVKLSGPHLLLQTRPREAASIIEHFAAELGITFNSN